MTDQELLELAAKAAGYPIHSDAWACVQGGGTPSLYMGNHGPKWNPLTDDGDAFRLAVKLGLFQDPHMDHSASQIHSGDECRDYRIAIVRAAAELGAEK